jgi:hypothetical protein
MYAHLDDVGSTKPRMLGEFGSHDDPAMGSKEQWLRDLPGTLRTAMPKLKAVVYFDRPATPSPATRAPGWPTAHPRPGPASSPPATIPT